MGCVSVKIKGVFVDTYQFSFTAENWVGSLAPSPHISYHGAIVGGAGYDLNWMFSDWGK